MKRKVLAVLLSTGMAAGILAGYSGCMRRDQKELCG